MKILHVYKDFDPPVHGGVERHIALMCRHQREWADVSALTCSRSPWTRRITRDETEVLEVGEWFRFQSTPLSPLFPYYLRREKADVIVIHTPNPTAELAYLMARPRGALIVRYHSDVVRQAAALRVYRPLLMHFLSKADIILPTSEQYIESSALLRPHRKKCRAVSLGIVPQAFSGADEDRVRALREHYGGAYVLFTGRHRYYKGLEYLVQAAPLIKAPIVIAGEGPETASLMALSQKLDASVFFPGVLSQEDLVNHLHGCDVFAFPSVERSEAFGISILEAHACGKPVVATKLGTGVEYANEDGSTGFNVKPRDVQALAEAINRLVEDRDLASNMGACARERVAREFNAARVARDEFDIYQEVAGWRKTGT